MEVLAALVLTLGVIFWPALALAGLARLAGWGFYDDRGEPEVGRPPGWAFVGMLFGLPAALFACWVLFLIFVPR